MKAERTIAGLRCSEVIARLDDYVASALSDAERAAVVAHVGACPLCTDFGGRYAATIAGIRRAHEAVPEEDLDAEARARLVARITGTR